ncbi:hypothetical protein [Rhizobium sp. GR12]|jgi:hypothetical protein|uniref:hypothetical protein n=1 Tax=Rhizobium sp. GR12 TaxID=3053925 RepID=UPI002FBE5AE5
MKNVLQRSDCSALLRATGYSSQWFFLLAATSRHSRFARIHVTFVIAAKFSNNQSINIRAYLAPQTTEEFSCQSLLQLPAIC